MIDRVLGCLLAFYVGSFAGVVPQVRAGLVNGDEPPNRITFDFGSRLDSGNMRTGIGAKVPNKQSGFLAITLLLLDQRPATPVSVEYPASGPAEIVAMQGSVYRVVMFGRRRVDMERVPNEKLPAGLVRLKPDSFTIPLQRHGLGCLNMPKIGSTRNERVITFVESIEPSKVGKKELTAHVTTEFPGKLPIHAIVRIGDTLLIQDKGYEVRNIVPADANTGIVGWVEFAPPISEADLIRDKKPFVRSLEKK